MQDEVCGNRWVGCDISSSKLWTVVRDSNYVPSIVVLSLVHQTEDLTLKSPKIMVNKELLKVVSLKISEKFDKKFSNSKLSWLQAIYNTNITLAILYRDFTNNAFTKT